MSCCQASTLAEVAYHLNSKFSILVQGHNIEAESIDGETSHVVIISFDPFHKAPSNNLLDTISSSLVPATIDHHTFTVSWLLEGTKREEEKMRTLECLLLRMLRSSHLITLKTELSLIHERRILGIDHSNPGKEAR